MNHPKLKIGVRHGHNGRQHLFLMDEQGRVLPRQRECVLHDGLGVSTIKVEFVIDGDDVSFEETRQVVETTDKQSESRTHKVVKTPGTIE